MNDHDYVNLSILKREVERLEVVKKDKLRAYEQLKSLEASLNKITSVRWQGWNDLIINESLIFRSGTNGVYNTEISGFYYNDIRMNKNIKNFSQMIKDILKWVSSFIDEEIKGG